MRNWIILLFFFTGFSTAGNAQITTITTGLPSSASSMGATRAGMTFVDINNNNYFIRIKSVDIYTSSTQSNDSFYLKYSATSLSGTPTGAASWPVAASTVAGTIPNTGIHPMFSNM